MNDTPKTDAEELCYGTFFAVPASLARELERENARLREGIKEIYNASCFHWDSMPEAGRKKFQEVVMESCHELLTISRAQ